MTCASINHVIIDFDSSRCSACPVCERDAEIARLKSDRLERIATQMMAAGLASNTGQWTQEELAHDAVSCAKALMAAVDKEAK